MPSASCTRRCAGSARWSCARPTTIRCRPAARSRSTAMDLPQPSRAALDSHPLIEIRREEIAGLPPADWDSVIIATGPLTSPALAEAIAELTGEDALAFFDAIAPIVHRDSIDMSVAWFQSRYDKAGPAAPAPITSIARSRASNTTRSSMRLLAGDKIAFHEWEAIDALFRRLPADRGDGGARPRDAAPRPDEAVRPDQSA